MRRCCERRIKMVTKWGHFCHICACTLALFPGIYHLTYQGCCAFLSQSHFLTEKKEQRRLTAGLLQIRWLLLHVDTGRNKWSLVVYILVYPYAVERPWEISIKPKINSKP
jgi:hypothetical protein